MGTEQPKANGQRVDQDVPTTSPIPETGVADREKLHQDVLALTELLRQQPFQLAVVIGSAGVGKSTLVPLVAAELGANTIMADELFATNPFFGPDKTDRQRWALSSNLWFLHQKVQLIQTELDRLAAMSTSGQPILIDSGLVMGDVYARLCLHQGLYQQSEYELFRALSAQLAVSLPPPDLILKLNLPVTELRRRIEQRGRDYELRRYTPAYLTDLAVALETEFVQLRQHGRRCLEHDL